MPGIPSRLAIKIHRQAGAAAVEFAIVAIFFFTLLLGIIEFGRALYVFNTLQEATRNLARKAVVERVSVSSTNAFKRDNALFGGTALPGGAEVVVGNVTVQFLDADGDVLTGSIPDDQFSECLTGGPRCVAFVRARITGAQYQPMIAGFFPFLRIPLPESTVTMPAESMGEA